MLCIATMPLYAVESPIRSPKQPCVTMALFLGGEVDLVGVGGIATRSRLVTGAGVGGANTASTGRATDGRVLLRGSVAVALAGGAGAARASRTAELVLIRGLLAGAVQCRLLSARAGGLLRCGDVPC